jgi:quercetin 2,3-dioxygenase
MKRSIVHNIEPLGFQWKARDPFLFCIHHEDHYPKGNDNMGLDDESLAGRNIGQDFVLKDGFRMYHGYPIPGFPQHPHRGFETVTIVREGFVDHSDSLGAAGRYGYGDVQWMTAGKGIQHCEMFPLINQDSDNPLELFQIWLNLPKANKFVEPYFKMLWAESVPNYIYTDESGKKTRVEVIAGSIGTNIAPDPPPDSWAADKQSNLAIWNIHMEAEARWILPKTSEGINRTIYFYFGEALHCAGTIIPKYHLAELLPEAEIELQSGTTGCHILLLQGKPIAEPVVQYGPFVMNTRKEIQQAYDDYQRTQFGGWPWPDKDNVHPVEKGRFALHADGKLETKD